MRARGPIAFAGAILVAGGAGITFLIVSTLFAQSADTTSLGSSTSCAATVNAPSGTASLDSQQLANARTIVQTGQALRVPVRGLVIAVATSLQEAGLRNLSYGDRDSVGLFQQRPSAGWGTVPELTDPPTASRKFFKALLSIPGWESMPLTDAAQAVQRSAFPFAYGKWESLAGTVVTHLVPVAHSPSASLNQVSCGDVVGASLPTGPVGEMLQVARNQLGKPYVWGATGPDAFDCSGLVLYAWRQAGHPLSVRTSQQMYNVSDLVTPGTEKAGDLLFGDFTPTGPGHVMIVVAPGTAIEAPHTGDVVKVVSYDSGAWTIGRLRSSAFLSGSIPG